MAKFSRLNGLDEQCARVYESAPLRYAGETGEAHDSRLKLSMTPKSIDLIQRANTTIVGCGTLGAPTALNMANKGYGSRPQCMLLCDFDTVQPENLATQPFTRDQIGLPKVFALAELILANSPYPMRVIAVNADFEELTRIGPELLQDAELTVAAVDSGLWRGRISRFVHAQSAFVTGGLSLNTMFGWVAWHTPDMPDFVDTLPNKSTGFSPGCTGVIADVSYHIAGLMSYAADCALFHLHGHAERTRTISWTYRRTFLDGFFNDEYLRKGGEDGQACDSA